MSVSMLQKRGTRAAIDAAAAANGLVAGQVYLITDEGNIAMATAVNAYQTYVKATGFKAFIRLTQAEYDALGTPDADTVYIISG